MYSRGRFLSHLWSIFFPTIFYFPLIMLISSIFRWARWFFPASSIWKGPHRHLLNPDESTVKVRETYLSSFSVYNFSTCFSAALRVDQSSNLERLLCVFTKWVVFSKLCPGWFWAVIETSQSRNLTVLEGVNSRCVVFWIGNFLVKEIFCVAIGSGISTFISST